MPGIRTMKAAAVAETLLSSSTSYFATMFLTEKGKSIRFLRKIQSFQTDCLFQSGQKIEHLYLFRSLKYTLLLSPNTSLYPCCIKVSRNWAEFDKAKSNEKNSKTFEILFKKPKLSYLYCTKLARFCYTFCRSFHFLVYDLLFNYTLGWK